MYLNWHFRSGTNKYKFMVYICDNDCPIFFVINSEIPQFIRMNHILYKSQVEILASNYPRFLEYDSYIDCSQIHTNIPNNDLDSQIRKNPGSIRGDLITEDKMKILENVSNSELIEPYRKSQIIIAIKDSL